MAEKHCNCGHEHHHDAAAKSKYEEALAKYNCDLSDDEAETTYQATIHGEAEGDEANFSVGADGSVQKEILEEAVYALYGQRPVTRNIPMDVVGRVKVGGQTFKAFGSTTLRVVAVHETHVATRVLQFLHRVHEAVGLTLCPIINLVRGDILHVAGHIV